MESPSREYWRKISLSLAATSTVAVTQILTKDAPGTALMMAVLLFAFTIPVCVQYGFQPPREPTEQNSIEIIDFFFVILFNYAGWFFVFLHFGCLAAAVFLVSSWASIRIFFTDFRSALPSIGVQTRQILLLLSTPFRLVGKAYKGAKQSTIRPPKMPPANTPPNP